MSTKPSQIPLLAFILFLLPRPSHAQDAILSRWQHADAQTQTFTLTLARSAFDTYVKTHAVINCPANLPPLLRERSGVFVSTMGTNGAPRCCMGTLYPMEANIAQEIINNAVTAAGRDHRFRPIKISELTQIRLIVTIVSRPTSIDAGAVAFLNPVRDGLVAKHGDRYGVVLSGETPHPDLFVRWAKIRAGAKVNDQTDFFRIDDVRFIEPPTLSSTK